MGDEADVSGAWVEWVCPSERGEGIGGREGAGDICALPAFLSSEKGIFSC